jgi:GLPGLI family protein
MKHFKTLLMLLLFSVNSFSQNFNVANYTCMVHLSEETKSADMQFQLLAKAEDVAEDVAFKLDFDALSSHFYISNPQDIDPMSLNMLKALSNTTGDIYTHTEDNTVIKEIKPKGDLVYIFGKQNILIKDSIFNPWEITGETKTINGYTCYKANYLKKQIQLDKEFIYKAVAWFCPEIPMSFGPAEYSGLPGLIFHLQSNEFSFILKSLEFEKNLVVRKPSAGKMMSLNEYLIETKKNMEQLKEMAKSFKE